MPTDSFYCAGRVRGCRQSPDCAGRLRIAQTPWECTYQFEYTAAGWPSCLFTVYMSICFSWILCLFIFFVFVCVRICKNRSLWCEICVPHHCSYPLIYYYFNQTLVQQSDFMSSFWMYNIKLENMFLLAYVTMVVDVLGPLLLTWFNLKPSMDK